MMDSKVIIYGRDSCPFCVQAREAYGDRALYVDIENDPGRLPEMLAYSKGDDRVPVIVEGGKILIGFNKDVFQKRGILLHGGT
jgi:glutaredoxin 3